MALTASAFVYNGAGLFIGVTGQLGGIGGSVCSVSLIGGGGRAGGSPIPLGGYACCGVPFDELGVRYCGGGAGGVTP